MPQLVEMDVHVTLFQQMDETASPVILINKFNVKSDDVEPLLRAWAVDGRLNETIARVHFNPASSWNWW